MKTIKKYQTHHYVYMYINKTEVLYIGKCDSNLPRRLSQHGKNGDNIPKEAWKEINNADIYYIQLANSTMSDVVESELIRFYKPKWNKAKKSEWDGIPLVLHNWKRYDPKTFDRKYNLTMSQMQHLKISIEVYELNAMTIAALNHLNNVVEHGKYKTEKTINSDGKEEQFYIIEASTLEPFELNSYIYNVVDLDNKNRVFFSNFNYYAFKRKADGTIFYRLPKREKTIKNESYFKNTMGVIEFQNGNFERSYGSLSIAKEVLEKATRKDLLEKSLN